MDSTSLFFAGAPANLSPSEIALQNAQIQHMGLQGQQQQFQLRQLAQQERDDQAARDAFARNVAPDGTLNRQGTLKDLLQTNPMAGMKIQHQWATEDAALQKGQREARKAELEDLIKEHDFLGQLVGSVKDQASYDRALAVARARKLDVSGMPTQYDPGLVNQYGAWSMTAKDQAEQEWKRLEAERRASEPLTEVGKINADEKRKNITPEEAAASRKKATTHSPAVQIGYSQPFELRDSSGNPVLVQQDKAGKLRPVEGYSPKDGGDKAMTESQSNALGFGIRTRDADAILTGLEAKGVNPGSLANRLTSSIPMLGNYAKSPDIQAYEQAQRNFVTAVLRKESGAAISPAEFSEEAKKYFPQPGDSPAVIQQKSTARKRAIQVLQIQSGRELPSVVKAVKPAQGQVVTKVNPANGRTYYQHPDGNFYLNPPAGGR